MVHLTSLNTGGKEVMSYKSIDLTCLNNSFIWAMKADGSWGREMLKSGGYVVSADGFIMKTSGDTNIVTLTGQLTMR